GDPSAIRQVDEQGNILETLEVIHWSADQCPRYTERQRMLPGRVVQPKVRGPGNIGADTTKVGLDRSPSGYSFLERVRQEARLQRHGAVGWSQFRVGRGFVAAFRDPQRRRTGARAERADIDVVAARLRRGQLNHRVASATAGMGEPRAV